MNTETSISILDKKAKNLYNKIRNVIEELMQDENWSFDGQTLASHAHNTSTCYFTFSYWNNTSTLDFTVRISDHNAVTGRVDQDFHLNSNESYSKKWLKENISKLIKHD